MSGTATPRIDVHVGDVSDSQLVIGDYNNVQTPKGAKVTVLQVGDRPVPRLRKLPLSELPAAGTQVVGREHELSLAAAVAPDSPLQLWGPEGAGKTALLKCIARAARPPGDGVLFASVRRRDFDELRNRLYTAFWETDQPFLPSPAEVGGYLTDRQAFILLDDCGLDRDDLEIVLDSAPRCTFVLASEEQTLWSRGRAQGLGGLAGEAGIALMEAGVGRPLDAGERGAAARIVAAFHGHPQSLVEVVALVRGGTATLAELARDPAAVSHNAGVLSASQRQLLAVLAAVDGATLAVEHLSVLAVVPDAARELEGLERDGWVKSQSPRYRLVRTFADDLGEPAEAAVADRLLEHLTAWAGRHATPAEIAQEAEAIEATLRRARTRQRWGDIFALASAAERQLTVAGSWGSSRRVLSSGLEAARALASEPAEAQMLHQLGSLALCLGDTPTAVTELEAALAIRERIGDAEGAEVTRHNLAQIGGAGGSNGDGGSGSGGDGPSGGGGGGRPRWPGIGSVLGLLAVVAAVVAGILALTHKSGSPAPIPHATAKPVKPPPRSGRHQPPAIRLLQPADGATYRAAATVRASYACSPAIGTRLVSCKGSVASGQPIDTSPGRHAFQVTARDRNGLTARRRVHYTVAAKGTGEAVDRANPTITIVTPADGASYHQDDEVTADYSCADGNGGSGIAPGGCRAEGGDTVDTSKVGDFEFTVTAVDRTGNTATRTTHYEVVASTPPDDSPPVITISSPRATAYQEGSQLVADFACSDEQGGSGTATCVGTLNGGGTFHPGDTINTYTPGTYTFKVTATDNAGNRNDDTPPVTYTVYSQLR